MRVEFGLESPELLPSSPILGFRLYPSHHESIDPAFRILSRWYLVPVLVLSPRTS